MRTKMSASLCVAYGQFPSSLDERILLTSKIGERLNKPYYSWKFSAIHRVPTNLREVQKKAFEPKIVSIGPFHYLQRKERLQAMEEHKARLLAQLLEGKFEGKSGHGETKDMVEIRESVSKQDDKHYPASGSVSLQELVGAMKELENDARACYSERFDSIKSEDFIEMMVMDGCFIVELLRLFYDHEKAQGNSGVGKGNSADEPLFKTAWMLRALQHDLLMLENQLPFFVLEKLFNLTKKAEGQAAPVPLEHLAVKFLYPLVSRRDPDPASMLSKRDDEHAETDYAHLLSIFRSTFLKKVRGKVEKPQSNHEGSIRIPVCDRPPKSSALENEEGSDTPISDRQLQYFASELQERGVKFEKAGTASDLLDVQFDEKTLRIPPLYITNSTLPAFLNFVAYEQCDERPVLFFTNYFIFLDNLVGSAEDVKILREAGILNPVFGSDKNVADLLQNLGREIVYVAHRSYLCDEVMKVIDHCVKSDKNWILKTWRGMIHKYFTSPWTLLSVLAAIIALVLTLVQTVFAVYPYYHPN